MTCYTDDQIHFSPFLVCLLSSSGSELTVKVVASMRPRRHFHRMTSGILGAEFKLQKHVCLPSFPKPQTEKQNGSRPALVFCCVSSGLRLVADGPPVEANDSTTTQSQLFVLFFPPRTSSCLPLWWPLWCGSPLVSHFSQANGFHLFLSSSVFSGFRSFNFCN